MIAFQIKISKAESATCSENMGNPNQNFNEVFRLKTAGRPISGYVDTGADPGFLDTKPAPVVSSASVFHYIIPSAAQTRCMMGELYIY